MLEKSMVKVAARGRWEMIFTSLAPELADAMKVSPRHAPACPMPGHSHAPGKFRFPKGWTENGKAICTCGAWSDGLSLLMALKGWTFPETLTKVAEVVGLADDHVRVLSTDDTKQTSCTGRLINIGTKDVRFHEKTYQVFAVRVLKKDGNRTELTGTLLEEACRRAGVTVGDNVRIDMTGIQSCTGSKGNFKRRLFCVEKLPTDAEEARQKEEMRQLTEKCLKDIDSLWTSASELTADTDAAREVRQYLAGRGLASLPASSQEDLRAAQAMTYRTADGRTEKFNGLVGAVRDMRGNLMCVHRTFLCQGKKAPVDAPKRLMRLGPGESVAGCAVHLGEPGQVLCVAEGIETAASVVIGTGYPCWSCISASGLKSVEIPDKVRLVFIFEDKDVSQTGQKAAAFLRERLVNEGKIAVICSIPDAVKPGSKGLDWNDILCSTNGINRFPVKAPANP